MTLNHLDIPHASAGVGGPGQLMVMPFPQVGPGMRLAYRDLHVAATTEDREQLAKLGSLAALPRPWDPGSCPHPDLRAEIWTWLDQVVVWLNHEYAWNTRDLIPPCWPRHPHLVHDLGTLADQRRRAGAGLTSNELEEWHRYCLPAFTQRMTDRLAGQCIGHHEPSPSRTRHIDHLSRPVQRDRHDTMRADTAVIREDESTMPSTSLRLELIDTDTGELLD